MKFYVTPKVSSYHNLTEGKEYSTKVKDGIMYLVDDNGDTVFLDFYDENFMETFMTTVHLHESSEYSICAHNHVEYCDSCHQARCIDCGEQFR